MMTGISGSYNPYSFSAGMGAAGQAQPAFHGTASAKSGFVGIGTASAKSGFAGIGTASAKSGFAGIGTASAKSGFAGAGTAATQPGVNGASQAKGMDDAHKVKGGYKSSPAECQTCKERKYQDGSNESDVSFKAPGHISPEASASTVMAHEQEHVANAYQKAAQKDGQVVSCSVSLHTAVCPECGTVYVSGGTTSTSISYPNESNPYQQNKKAQDAIRLTGANIDYAA